MGPTLRATLLVTHLFASWTPIGAFAADLNIVAAGAVRSVLRGTVLDYQKATNDRLHLTIASTGQLREIISSGAPADLIIAAAPLMDEFEKSGKVVKDSRIELGAIGLGSVARPGMTSADLSTAEGLRQAILDARKIAYTDPKLGGASYLHLLKIAEQFNLVDAVKSKGVYATGGDDAAGKVKAGEADLAIVFLSEVEAAGAQLAATVPDSLQLWAAYSAAIPVNSHAPVEALGFITALSGNSLRQRWIDAGWKK